MASFVRHLFLLGPDFLILTGPIADISLNFAFVFLVYVFNYKNFNLIKKQQILSLFLKLKANLN